jgi:hypothetical protein
MKTLLIVVSSILGMIVLSLTLSGTPPASAHPPGTEQPVRITNPTVPVTLPAQQGFNVSCFTGNIDPVSGQAQCSLLTIPAGRSVVIETISCQAVLVAGQGPGDVQLIVPNTPLAPGGPGQVSHLLALSKQAGDSSIDVWRMTTPLRAYGSAPAAGSVDVYAFFRANPAPQPQSMICTASGYLVGP